MNKDLTALRLAYDTWSAAAQLRRDRDRQKRYTYGDQWSDLVDDHAGHLVREGDLMHSRGHRVLTNNLIRQLVKAVVGRFRDLRAEARAYDTAPGSDDVRNQLAELDARMLEEFIISGCAIQRVTAERRPQGSGLWVDNVNPRQFFVNAFRDPRGSDIRLVGMLHDMHPGEVVNRFGRGSSARSRELLRLYDSIAADAPFTAEGLLGAATPAAAGFFDAPAGLCRVVELWTLDARPVNDGPGRMHMQFDWHQRWLAPDGSLLFSSPSPYPHASHPFVIRFYPLTDGEVHSFVEDVIDQQRTINRMVVMIDSMLASSAKGTLLFPIRRLLPELTIDDIARAWSSPDSVIPIADKGEMPAQIVTNTADSGAYQALQLQMQLLSDISGMSDAILGRNISAATGTEMYREQVRNASVTLTDLLGTYTAFLTDRDQKMHKTQQ